MLFWYSSPWNSTRPALTPALPVLNWEVIYWLLVELLIVRPKLICCPPLALMVGNMYSQDWSYPILYPCELMSDWATNRLFRIAMATSFGSESVAPTESC